MYFQTGGGVPSILQEVQVPIIENQVCQDMFETAGHTKSILSSFLCAGYANGQRDSCEVCSVQIVTTLYSRLESLCNIGNGN